MTRWGTLRQKPLKPQIPDIKAKGVMRIQLIQLCSVLMAQFFFASLVPSVKITRSGYLDICNTLKYPAVRKRLRSSGSTNASSGFSPSGSVVPSALYKKRDVLGSPGA